MSQREVSAALRSQNCSMKATLILCLLLIASAYAKPVSPSFVATEAKSLWSAIDNTTRAGDKWAETHFKESSDLSFWKGVGRWYAWQAIAEARPGWADSEKMMLQTYLWNDEQKPVVPLNSENGDPNKSLLLLKMLDGYAPGSVDAALSRYYLSPHSNSRALLLDIAPELGDEGVAGWLGNIGHPLLECQVEYQDGYWGLAYRQAGFSIYPDQPLGNEQQQWALPLVVAYQDDTGVNYYRAWANEQRGFIPLPSVGKVLWAYPNGSGLGCFRTILPPEDCQLLHQAASQLQAPALVAYCCNQWRLVRNGRAGIGSFFDTVEATKSNPDLGLADLFTLELDTVKRYVALEDLPAYQRFMASSLVAFSDARELKLLPSDDDRTRVLMAYALRLRAFADDPPVVDLGKKWAADWMADKRIPGAGFQMLSRDPKVFTEMMASTRRSFAKGKSGHTWDLARWPEAGRSKELVEAVLESQLSDQKKRSFLSTLVMFGYPQTAVWDNIENPVLHDEKLFTRLLDSSQRERFEEWLDEDKVGSVLSETMQKKAKTGAYATLKPLTREIHLWLAENGYD